MGVKTTAKVWDWSQAEGTERLVMLALADFCDDQDECYPGVQRIAAKCRISERTAQRAFKTLSDSGELRVLVKFGVRTNGGATNRFKLLFPGRKGGDIQGLSGVGGGDIQRPKVVTNRAQGGDTAMTPEPSENHQKEPSGEPAPLIPEGFEDFQQAWNSLPQDFPKIQTMSSGRARALKARLKEKFWRDNWKAGLERMGRSSFLAGKSRDIPEGAERSWRATVEWFLKPDSLAKIMEGKYDDAPEKKAPEFWRAHL